MRWILKMNDGFITHRKKLGKLLWLVEEIFEDKYKIIVCHVSKKTYKCTFKLVDDKGVVHGEIYNNQWRD